MASSLILPAWIDSADATLNGLNIVSASNKLALFTNLLTPNPVTDTSFTSAPYTSNEVSSAGYTAGGAVIAGQTFVASSGPNKMVYDATDQTFTGVTFTARWAIFYADGLAGNNVYFAMDFGADFPVAGGDFVIQFNASGIIQWTV
jgi:hypothetical protein